MISNSPLGTGDPEKLIFSWLLSSLSDKLSITLTSNLFKIYNSLHAKSFEPCGLSQMMAIRYGTLPLVHEVGGCVIQFNPSINQEGTGTGFGDNWHHTGLAGAALDVYRSTSRKFGEITNKLWTM